MNYDFESNWTEVIFPLLHTDKIQNSIEKGVNNFIDSSKEQFIYEYILTKEERELKNINTFKYMDIFEKRATEAEEKGLLKGFNKRFKKYDYPLSYSRGDRICLEDDDIEELIVPMLLEQGILKKDENEPKRIDFENEEDYIEECDYYWNDWGIECQQYQKYKDEIVDSYMNLERNKNYIYYCCYGACHWYNPTFCLELAKLVMPEIDWQTLRGSKHTTITNKDETLVFDILYFDNNDTETFGGKKALAEANYDCDCGDCDECEINCIYDDCHSDSED